ncbi:MAG: PEP-CTERM sorting domain-containing protein [Cyanobacteria bacterium J06592_8]
MNKLKLLIPTLTVTATTLFAGNAFAASLNYATTVESYTQGKFLYDDVDMINSRTNTDNALGAPDKGNVDANEDFLSLGFGGEAVFSFDTGFSGEVKIWETTWDSKDSQKDYWEEAAIFVGDLDGNWFELGSILNIEDGAYDPTDGKDTNGQLDGGASLFTTDLFGDDIFHFVKVIDITPDAYQRQNRDGFDINAIAVQGIDDTTSVPEPSAMLGLGIVAMGLAGKKFVSGKRLSK